MYDISRLRVKSHYTALHTIGETLFIRFMVLH
jgi:hypothetical protein